MSSCRAEAGGEAASVEYAFGQSGIRTLLAYMSPLRERCSTIRLSTLSGATMLFSCPSTKGCRLDGGDLCQKMSPI